MPRIRFSRTWSFGWVAAPLLLLAACGGGGGSAALPGQQPAPNVGAGNTPGPNPSSSGSPIPGPTNAPPTPLPSSSPPPPAGLIKHVVIIIQENRSTDNLFNGLPGADTVRVGMKDGQQIALTQDALGANIDPCHLHPCWIKDYDGGKMDGFADTWPQQGNVPYTYVQQSDVQPYFTLAEQYAFADRMFQSDTGPSFPAHLYLIAGQSAGIDALPWNNNNPPPTNTLWSCGAPPGTEVSQELPPSGQTVQDIFPCVGPNTSVPNFPTLADDLESHGHTWKYYAPGVNESGYVWSAFSAVSQVYYNASRWANVVSPETTVLTDAANGTLPDVTWVTPDVANSDHASGGKGTTGGPSWVASIVNAIGNSPNWNSTAIFITWDDWGGFYDHVVPPQIDYMGLGFRVPLIAVSPYAKSGYVSHVTHDFGSILHFSEEAFSLPSLGQRDATADDLRDMFDFTQPPRPYITVQSRLRATDIMRQPHSNAPPDND